MASENEYKDSPILTDKHINSIKSIVTTIVVVGSMIFGIVSFVTKTFPTATDIKDALSVIEMKIVPKPEYYKKINDIEDRITALTEENRKKHEYIRKESAEDITKLRAEYRTEKLLDVTMRLKIVDETLLKDPNNQSLKNYRQFLCKEYDRIQGKLDNSLRDLEK